jgi:hypothetical protein
MKKYKIEMEETTRWIRATALKNDWLCGLNPVPFQMTYWKKPRRDRFSEIFHEDTEINFDTSIFLVEDIFEKTYFYRNGIYQLSADVTIPIEPQPTIIRHIERDKPIRLKTLQEREPIIDALEMRVGKNLINR